MPQNSRNVSIETLASAEDAAQLPTWFNEHVLICRYLRDSGLFEAIEQRFRLDRSTGYQVIDLVVAAVAYFSAAGEYSGFRSMLDEVAIRGWSRPLAAMGNRAGLCSQPSMSRLLDAIDEPMADEFTDWILRVCNSGELEHHEAALWRDCRGERWHGFGIDGRVQPFRRRGLVEGAEYPPARRSVDKLGVTPGYSGRKRADVQMSRSILEHLGSGLSLAMNYTPGNGELCSDFEVALDQIERWAEQFGHDPGRCFLAIDGEQKGYPQMRAGMASPVHFLTRLAHYGPLAKPGFRHRLHEQNWQKVSDSNSGPQRWATEMGTWQEGPDEARLVVSCFEPANNKKSGAGYFADGLQYEVYACDLPQEGFGASETVNVYYGRAGRQENNFGRADRQMNLEHMFSDNPAGQKVVMAVGMAIRNLRAVLGAELQGTLQQPEYEPVDRQVDTVEQLPFDTAVSPEGHREQSTPTPVAIDASPDWWNMVTRQVRTQLNDRQPEFDYDPDQRAIRCATGKHLKLSGYRQYADATVTLRFRISTSSHCRGCPFRSQCTRSTSPDYRKTLEVTVCCPEQFESAPETERDDSHDDATDTGSCSMDDCPEKTPGSGADDGENNALIYAHVQPVDSDVTPPGRWQMRTPMLKTSALRTLFKDVARALRITIKVTPPPDKPRKCAYLADDPGDRQHRRHTWEWRMNWNRLSEQAEVDTTIKAPTRYKEMLTTGRPPPESATA